MAASRCGGTGDCSTAAAVRATLSAPMPDAEPLQRMRQRRHRLRLAAAHARQQQTGLPVEQLQHLALEAAVAERHAREMARSIAGSGRLLGRSCQRIAP